MVWQHSKDCRENGSAKGQVVNQEMQATIVVNHETQERKLSEGAGGQKMAQWFLKLIYQIQYFQF